jgi:hypothetical protein
MMRLKVFAVGAALALAASSASAETLHFGASLKGADETPPNDSAGTGKVTATLDTATKLFKYKVAYSGLTGPAKAAHFHGPAAPGADAPPVVPVPTSALANPMRGSATLTDEQIGQLEGGKWYFNIHTAAHPGGELRGQVEEQP